MSPIDLRARCSRYFTWADLIERGETWARLQREGIAVPNVPQQGETFEALAALASALLDPLHDHFGAVELTYGFAGPSLTRHIPKRISPPHDQHASFERNTRGGLVCARGGAACDLRVPGVGTFAVARWIRDTLPFDRMYLYGDDRPLHLSHTKAPLGRIIAMRVGGRGHVPLDVTHRLWGDIEALLTGRTEGP